MATPTAGAVAGPSTPAAGPPGYTFHLPETFDPAGVTRREWADYACWVVSAVVFRRFVEKDAGDDTFVPLDSRFVERFVPANVRPRLFRDLIAAGVLECDGRSRPGRFSPGGRGKCRCYRLGPGHRGAKLRPHPATHPELLRKVAAAGRADRDAVTDPVHVALRGWAERVEVLPAAPRGEHLLLEKLVRGEHWFTVCDQGRVHTNVTNLPRQYRQYLRLAGRELVSIDIAASQPLILAVLLTADAGRRGRESVTHREEPTRPAAQAIVGTCPDPSLNEFLRDCLAGAVYDRIAGATGYTRELVKRRFLAVVYGRPRNMHTQVGLAVQRLYPAVFNAVRVLNTDLGHGGLPRAMQRLESGVMILGVAGRLIREHPGLPLLTVHDSVVVPEEHVPLAEEVIDAEWHAAFGITPGVKVSAFTAAMAAGGPRPAPARATGRGRGGRGEPAGGQLAG